MLVHTSLVGRLWRISAECARSNCLILGVHSTHKIEPINHQPLNSEIKPPSQPRGALLQIKTGMRHFGGTRNHP